VNVSVRRPGEPLGTRCEIKNLNSIRFIGEAIELEARRQVDLLEDGGSIRQETRLFDPGRGETRSMRSKEEAHDYRYFPDPDLLPLDLSELSPSFVADLQQSLPELPDQKAQRFMSEYGLSAYDAGVLTASAELGDYYEVVVRDLGGHAKLAANTVMGELAGLLNRDGVEIGGARVDAHSLAALLRRVADNTISGKIAKDVLEAMWDERAQADAIIESRGLRQITDEGAIERAIEAVMAANPAQLADYRAGKDKLFGFFVGQVMKATAGKANPARLNELLKKKLSG